LLPAALQGINIDELILGAKQCDEVTRSQTIEANPAALLALTWHYAGQGKGSKDMVLLPYKDRLELFSRYLQQLIMESLGKEFDLEGHAVHQGLSVFGNKGSTDQHAFVQQLRDGLNNFFAVFIQVLRERRRGLFIVESEITSGDYLQGFYLGTRQALYEKDRESITVTVDEVRPFTIGVLIALFERAVGLYASMVKINAYHQPGVEAGKKAAGAVIALQLKVLRFLRDHVNQPLTSAQIASGIGAHDAYETVFHICEYLSAQPERKIEKGGGTSILERTYRQL
jgi:glucose-6-phosphate isomerase